MFTTQIRDYLPSFGLNTSRDTPTSLFKRAEAAALIVPNQVYNMANPDVLATPPDVVPACADSSADETENVEVAEQ